VAAAARWVRWRRISAASAPPGRHSSTTFSHSSAWRCGLSRHNAAPGTLLRPTRPAARSRVRLSSMWRSRRCRCWSAAPWQPATLWPRNCRAGDRRRGAAAPHTAAPWPARPSPARSALAGAPAPDDRRRCRHSRRCSRPRRCRRRSGRRSAAGGQPGAAVGRSPSGPQGHPGPASAWRSRGWPPPPRR
jgi:hypothetical protein